MTQKNALTKRNLWSYSLGTIGRDMAAAGLFTNYLLNYVLYTKTLNAQQFAAISIIMVLARIFDAFNDPIMGNILDATATRWGKFKPWILAGTLSTVAVIAVSFSNTLQGWSYVILFGVLYFLFSIAFTMNDIAYWGMLPSLAANPDDRNRLTSLTSLMAGIGGFLCGLIVPTFTAGERVIGGSAVTAYAVIALLFCAAMLLSQLITLVGVKERPLPPARQARTKVSLRVIVTTLRRNDQALWSSAILFIHFLVSTVVTTVSGNYLYFTFGYNGLLITLFNILGQGVSAVIYMVFPAISRKTTRARLIGLATVCAVFGYAAMLAAGLFLPAALGMAKFAVLAVANLFSGVGIGIYYLIMMVNIANSVEYNEWKTGQRNEGIIYSIRPFVTKLGMALAQFLAMLIYLAAGVLGTTNQISDMENAAAQGAITMADKTAGIEQIIAGIPGGQPLVLLLFLTLLPMAGVLAEYFIYRKKIILSEDKYAEILADLDARRGAQA